ncbi:DNA polymerase III subunit epsilon, partial [Paraburkholderia sp. Se-20369]|nr:DNA polymerase III subunit epsilon [Paraburkholderia sp. Se-20369]
LAADETAGPFEPATHRLLQTHLARGLQLIPLVALAAAGE